MQPRPAKFPAVPIRLAQHAGARRLAVRASVEKDPSPFAGTATIWRAPLPDRVELYVRALRDGVPKLASGADPHAARIIAAGKQERTDVMKYVIELAVPPICCSELAPLAQLLSTSVLGGVRDAVVEEIGAVELRECNDDERVRRIVPPFPFQRATSREQIKMGTLEIDFESDLTDAGCKQLEQWVKAWFRLVEAGGFLVSGGGPSYAQLTEAVDPYPDTWTFHFRQVVVDDDACAPLLERLSDMHRVHPIKKVTLG